jgi:cellulose synthase operon protein C
MTTRHFDQPKGETSLTAFHMTSGWLDAEIEAAKNSGLRALLLHESALIHEIQGNSTEAARLQLQSVNTDPHFSEPVERLLILFEQRHSLKNLGRVVERLHQLASTVEERERAAWEQAAFALIEQRETYRAKEVLLDVVEAVPNGIVGWILLNIVAEQAQDFALLERTLRTRASLTDNASWSGILLLELAEIQNELGRFDAALETLDEVIAANGPMTFNALDVLDRLSFTKRQHDVLSRVLVSKASILERAIHDDSLGEALGVPRFRRSKHHVADAFLRAAIARQADGNSPEAATLMERALSLSPDDPLLEHVALLCAEARNDLALAVSLARSLAGKSRDNAGSAWLRTAFCELARGNGDGALDAIASGLVAAPHSVALKATELHILAAKSHAVRFATAVESCAETLGSDAAKCRQFLAASEIWARRARDANSARAALTQAALLGANPLFANRVARLLASYLNEVAWYDESTRRLATASPKPEEQRELWIELARHRALKGQLGRSAQALTAFASQEPNSCISNVFCAYCFGDSSDTKNQDTSANSLQQLALKAPGPAFAHAFSIANALRSLRSGNRTLAVAQLTELADKDPADGLVIATLSDILLADGAPSKAAELLCNGSGTISDTTIAAIAALKAALIFTQTGDAVQCRQSLDTARLRAPAAANVAEPWILRKLFPNDASVRRQVLENLMEEDSSERLVLERFALEVGTGNVATAGLILENAPTSSTAIGIAIAFSKALLDGGSNTATIAGLTEQVPELRAVAAALGARCAFSSSQFHSLDYLEAVRQWVFLDDAVEPALEYLCVSRALINPEAEYEAWELLSSRLGDAGSMALKLAQARTQLFNSNQKPTLFVSRDTQTRILNCELSPPGCDPRRRSFALSEIEPLLSGVDRGVSRTLAAFNILAGGNAQHALKKFREAISNGANNVAVFEGLKLAAQMCGDDAAVAEACEALARQYHDAALAAELFEQAANLWFTLNDESRGEEALRQAVARDIHRFSSFDKLFRRVRDKNDGSALIELIDARLDVSDDADELVKLHWERARVLRSLGSREAALQALENVTLLEPDHVGALALAAEISIATSRLSDAAKFLDRLARLDSAPHKQRVMSGLAAADLFDGKLGSPEQAVSVLLVLVDAGLVDLAARERLARAAARCENWGLAAETLLTLASERESGEGRTEASRLALSIYRDRLGQLSQSLPAVRQILAEQPDDPEAIDCITEQPFSREINWDLCVQVASTLRTKLIDQPLDEASIARLARVAAILDDVALRHITLGALASIGAGSPEVLDEIERLGLRVPRLPTMTLDEACFRDLAETGDEGPHSELFAVLGPYFTEALGPSLSMLQVSKKQRVEPRSGLPLRNEIASWAGALGVSEFDLYVGGISPDNVVGIPGETPSLVVGSALRAPLSPAHRQLVARELYAIRRGTSILRHRSGTEVAALVVATCRIAEVPISAPPYALVDEFSRLLNSVIPRKVRKVLPSLCSRVAQVGADPMDWQSAAVSSQDRMAVVAAGDVSLVVAGDRQADFTGSQQRRLERLLRFVFSYQYQLLRERLGIGVK